MQDLLKSLENDGLYQKADVIRETYYNPTEKYATKFYNILKHKKSKMDEIPVREAAAIQLYLGESQADYQSWKNLTDRLPGDYIS